MNEPRDLIPLHVSPAAWRRIGCIPLMLPQELADELRWFAALPREWRRWLAYELTPAILAVLAEFPDLAARCERDDAAVEELMQYVPSDVLARCPWRRRSA